MFASNITCRWIVSRYLRWHNSDVISANRYCTVSVCNEISNAACAVNMVITIANSEQRALDGIEVNVAIYRDTAKPADDVSLYDSVQVEFEMWGVSDDDARFMVKA